MPQILVVKKQLHGAYVRREEIIRSALMEGRPPDAGEQKRIDRLNRVMKHFYDAGLGAGSNSSASSRLQLNPPRDLISSEVIGLGGISSNAQPTPSASTATAKAPDGIESSGISKNPVAEVGNTDAAFTLEDSTSSHPGKGNPAASPSPASALVPSGGAIEQAISQSPPIYGRVWKSLLSGASVEDASKAHNISVRAVENIVRAVRGRAIRPPHSDPGTAPWPPPWPRAPKAIS